MMSTKFIAGLAVFAAAASAQAATVLSQGFADVASLTSAGWVQTNNSVPTVGDNFVQGNIGIFSSAQAGPANSFAAASFTNTTANAGAISSWLLTPTLLLDNTSTVSFFVRTAGNDFLDRLEVRLSLGAGSDVGVSTTSVGTFTTLLGSFQSSVATGWTSVTYTVPGLTLPSLARVGFRYMVDDVAVNGNYLGIDTLTITAAVPEPGTYALLGLGLAGLLVRRRLVAA